ncbi:pseudouridine synthase [candidate division GN15 bacterium]|nr:pseudouridine synthase [candidate division GN15 bacterium]
MAEAIRINKYLSQCGIASRRAAEELIDQGRVKINGEVLDRQGVRVDAEADVVEVDGTQVKPVPHNVYVLLNKPVEVVTTLDDPQKRPTVKHLVKDVVARVYPVGRLDYDTEGALLLTNDGELAHRLTHPKWQVEKVYEARVSGRFLEAQARQIEEGIKLEDGAIGRAKVDIVEATPKQSLLKLTLTEGRKREVRQLCKAVGHPVLKLKRVSFGGIVVGSLKPGQWRMLTSEEIRQLRGLVEL